MSRLDGTFCERVKGPPRVTATHGVDLTSAGITLTNDGSKPGAAIGIVDGTGSPRSLTRGFREQLVKSPSEEAPIWWSPDRQIQSQREEGPLGASHANRPNALATRDQRGKDRIARQGSGNMTVVP